MQIDFLLQNFVDYSLGYDLLSFLKNMNKNKLSETGFRNWAREANDKVSKVKVFFVIKPDNIKV